jgi:hypothetical protein
LQLILPELLLLGLVQERKVADMVYKHVAKNGQLRVLWRNFTRIRPEGRAKALKGGRGGKLRDLELGLLGYELALEICPRQNRPRAWGCACAAYSALVCP